MKVIWFKIGICISIILIFLLVLLFVMNKYKSLDNIKQKQDMWKKFYEKNKFFSIIIFGLSYIGISVLPLPITPALKVLSGAIFGFIPGLFIVSFASTIGATLSFLISRFLFKGWVQTNFHNYFININNEFIKDGAFYLFALRLIPIFPFFLINILTALLPIKVWTFYWVSQLGMLLGTAIYVYAGTKLS